LLGTGVFDFVGVNVLVKVDVGTSVSVGVKVFVGTRVFVGVNVFDGVNVNDGVNVLVGVKVAGIVFVGVKVTVAVGAMRVKVWVRSHRLESKWTVTVKLPPIPRLSTPRKAILIRFVAPPPLKFTVGDFTAEVGGSKS
jgi:hypothetical protein